MKLTSCTAPVWGNAECTSILCVVTFEEFGDEKLPFNCMPTDSAEHGRDLWTRLIEGEFGPIGEYIAPALAPAMASGVGPRVIG